MSKASINKSILNDSKASPISDFLNYYLMLEDGVILHKDNKSFSITFEVIAPDVDFELDYTLKSIKELVQNAISFLPVGFIIESNLITNKVKSFKKGTNKKAPTVARLLHNEQAEIFTDSRNDFFTTKLYYTLTYSQLDSKASSFFRDFFKKIFFNSDYEIKDEDLGDERLIEFLKNFRSEVDQFKELLVHVGIKLKKLKDEELYNFLYKIINEREREVKGFNLSVLNQNINLSNSLDNSDGISGENLEFNGKKIKCISLDNLALDYDKDLLHSLYTLPVECRYTARFFVVEKDKSQEIFSSKLDSFSLNKALSRGNITRGEGEQTDDIREDTVNELYRNQLKEILHNAGMGKCYGYMNLSIIVSDENEEILDEKIQTIFDACKKEGFTPAIETANPTHMWLGSIPSQGTYHCVANLIDVRYFAHAFPTFGLYQGINGSTYDRFKNAPALLQGVTKGNRIYCLNLIDRDLGHTKICGVSGGGKTMILCQIGTEWLIKYEDGRIIGCDFKKGLYVYVKSLNGVYIDIFDKNIKLAPFSHIHDEKTRNWTIKWLLHILKLKVKEEKDMSNNIYFSSKKEENYEDIVTSAVERLLQANKDVGYPLTFNNFINQIDNVEVQRIYRRFLKSMPEHLWHGTEDESIFNTGRPTFFDMYDVIYQKPESFSDPISSYLNKRMITACLGYPTAYLGDELTYAWASDFQTEFVFDNFKTGRHEDRHLIYGIQATTETPSSADNITMTINTKNYIYLPTVELAQEDIQKAYRRQGLNDREIEVLKGHSSIKGSYYVKQEWAGGNRMASFKVTDLGLYFYGVTAKNVDKLKKFDEIYVQDSDCWIEPWIEYNKELESDRL